MFEGGKCEGGRGKKGREGRRRAEGMVRSSSSLVRALQIAERKESISPSASSFCGEMGSSEEEGGRTKGHQTHPESTQLLYSTLRDPIHHS
jgi:hypothetical protein